MCDYGAFNQDAGEPHEWRFGFQCSDGERRSLDDGHGEIDEIKMDQWLHIERMDDNKFWVRVGDTEFDVSMDASGNATVARRSMKSSQTLWMPR